MIPRTVRRDPERGLLLPPSPPADLTPRDEGQIIMLRTSLMTRRLGVLWLVLVAMW